MNAAARLRRLALLQELGLRLTPPPTKAALAVQRRFADLLARVPPQASWMAPDVDQLDRLSIRGWLKRQGAGELAG